MHVQQSMEMDSGISICGGSLVGDGFLEYAVGF